MYGYGLRNTSSVKCKGMEQEAMCIIKILRIRRKPSSQAYICLLALGCVTKIPNLTVNVHIRDDERKPRDLYLKILNENSMIHRIGYE